MTTMPGPLDDYFRSVAAVDVQRATDLVLELFDEGTPPALITTSVLAPAQVRVGEMWEAGTWSVADEHAATVVTDVALSALLQAYGTSSNRDQRHLVVVCVEGEWHSLPARMAAAVAATGDARVTVLGASLPADQLHRRLSGGDVDVLALSCTMPTNLIGAARCIAAAHALHVPVIVGGRAFGTDAERAHAVGADGWAADADALLGAAPGLAGRTSEVPLEALLLDAVDDAVIDFAYDRMVSAFPLLSRMTTYQQARAREDLVWMSRFTGAAVLTADARVVDDLLDWLVRLLRGRVPADVVSTSAHLLADAVEPVAPCGASILRQAAADMDDRQQASA